MNCIDVKPRKRDSSLPLTLTDRPASFYVRDTPQTPTGAQGNYYYMPQPAHGSRDKRLLRPLIKKENKRRLYSSHNGSVNK